jgi:hypothetical protein
MRLRAFCAGLTLLGLLSSDVVASTVDDSEGEANKTAETLELFAACESSYPLLSVRWGDGDIERAAAETASAFLDVPSVTPQVIIDKAKECFRALRSERGMMAVDFDHVELRCGVGPDIQWGRIVVVHVN